MICMKVQVNEGAFPSPLVDLISRSRMIWNHISPASLKEDNFAAYADKLAIILRQLEDFE